MSSDAHIDSEQVVRVRHDGRVYRWQRRHAAWPGKVSYLIIGAQDIELGDRYARDAYECSFRCHPQDFMDGCFHDSVTATFGAEVLAEVLAETRLLPRAQKPEPKPEPVASATEPERTAPEPSANTSANTPASKSNGKSDGAAAAPAALPERVKVVLTGCQRLDLTLAAALRTITRTPIKKTLAALRKLPYVLLTDVPLADARAHETRLSKLGATVQLQP